VNHVHNVNVIHTSTTSTPRRTSRREARIDEILDAALEIAASEGIDGLTIQRLATAMDWSVGALYRYYRGKDALLVAMQQRVLGRLGRKLEAARTGAAPAGSKDPADALASVLAVVEAFRRFAAEDTVGFSLIIIFLGDPRVLLQDDEAEQVAAAMRPLLATTAAAITGAESHGALAPGDPTDRTLVLWASLHGLIQLGKLDRLEPRFSRSSDRLTQTLLDGLLLGWGADPAALAAARSILGDLP